MANKKDTQRANLHKAIWDIANDLRGSVDGWDFKAYVLSTLFYRFISENLSAYIEKNEDGEFKYAKLDDAIAQEAKDHIVKEKGFFILPSELFCNVVKNAKDDENLNTTLHNAFKNIENSALGYDSEKDLKGLFDDFDVNSPKLGNTTKAKNEKLFKILTSINNLDLGNYQDNSIDVFGDAYEYLMAMYASSAGKSGGEFFTPQEVSELLAKITLIGKKSVNKIYDPCCGSGSLLLKFAKVLGKENIDDGFYGQEINISTYNLCRINMFLHDIPYNKFDIALGDTLTEPRHWNDEPFEAIVSNPPYSIKWVGDSDVTLINDPRFSPAGVLAPKSKADLAFTMHMLSWLSDSGTAAIVEFPGVLYRGGAEEKIRKYLVDNNFVDTVIQLPSDLFFGTSIATCILVLKKNKSNDTSILFIDATNEFTRSDTKNRLTDKNIDKILQTIKDKKEIDHFSRVVKQSEILKNDYNLSVSKYVLKPDTREVIDIKALNLEISQIVAKQAKLRTKLDKIIADLESI